MSRLISSQISIIRFIHLFNASLCVDRLVCDLSGYKPEDWPAKFSNDLLGHSNHKWFDLSLTYPNYIFSLIFSTGFSRLVDGLQKCSHFSLSFVQLLFVKNFCPREKVFFWCSYQIAILQSLVKNPHWPGTPGSSIGTYEDRWMVGVNLICLTFELIFKVSYSCNSVMLSGDWEWP